MAVESPPPPPPLLPQPLKRSYECMEDDSELLVSQFIAVTAAVAAVEVGSARQLGACVPTVL